jgi:hypothetical protein
MRARGFLLALSMIAFGPGPNAIMNVSVENIVDRISILDCFKYICFINVILADRWSANITLMKQIYLKQSKMISTSFSAQSHKQQDLHH